MKRENRTPVPNREDFKRFAIGSAMLGAGAAAAAYGLQGFENQVMTTFDTFKHGFVGAAGMGTAAVGGVSAARTDTGKSLGRRAGNAMNRLEDKATSTKVGGAVQDFLGGDKAVPSEEEKLPDNVIKFRPREERDK